MELRKITKEELDKIIDDHQHYLNQDIDGWDGDDMKAHICGVEIEGFDLRGVNLEQAIFEYVRFVDTDLSNANLEHAEIYNSNFESVQFKYTNLNNSIITRTSFEDNKFYHTDLSFSTMHFNDFLFETFDNCNLSCIDIEFSNLFSVEFIGSNLTDIRFTLCDLQYIIDKTESISRNSIPMICPEVGSFIGYKKASGKIIKLSIPSSAKRLSCGNRMCRCDKAKVLAIEEIDGTKAKKTKVRSDFDHEFIYEIGKTVKANNFDNNNFDSTSGGINFFITRQEAVEHTNIKRSRPYLYSY